jgi:glc operon protein GlcG
MRSFTVLVCAATLATAAWAQSPPLTYGPPVTLEEARQIASVAETEAKARHVVVTIAIVDSGGTLVLEQRMDGATLASADTAPAKAKSAVMWKRPTSLWLDSAKTNPAPLSFPHVVASPGGELLVRDGRIVGAVGVGGSGQNEGDIIAKRAAASLKSAPQ